MDYLTLQNAPLAVGSPTALWVAALSALAGTALLVRRLVDQRSVQRRLAPVHDEAEFAGAEALRAVGSQSTTAQEELFDSRLEEWLFVSGFRSERAPASFLWAQAGAILAGVLLAIAIASSGIAEIGRQWLEEIPGGIGSLFGPIVSLASWILFVLVSLIPVAFVRRRRRAIVAAVERDLPVVLGLLATLVESGVGFDAALDQVRVAMGEERPLAEEFRRFRTESRAGIPRVVSFRRIARRLEIGAVSVFISAMIHAEFVGASVAETLRRQADEVWSRRRERAIQIAQTLPTKLAFPLVICFLPGIFVWTFGPAVAEFVRIAEGVLLNRP
ncbi:MAG: type II secretion system F family protein [Planctomycetota bacterium]